MPSKMKWHRIAGTLAATILKVSENKIVLEIFESIN